MSLLVRIATGASVLLTAGTLVFLNLSHPDSDVLLTAYGKNTLGQLGNHNAAGTEGTAYLPTQPVALSAGFDHTLALLNDGTVMAWGDNRFGQLGLSSSKSSINAPKPITSLPEVAAIATGFRHSLALSADGEVYAWGSNIAGQLGDGTTTSSTTPQLVPLPDKAIMIAAGHRFSLAQLNDGRVYAWGANCEQSPERTFADLLQMIGEGATGISYYVDGSADPSHAREQELCEFQGFVFVQSSTPVTIPELNGAIHLAAGFGHVVALMPDATIRTAGCNAYGQLGRVQLEVTPPQSPERFSGTPESVRATAIAASTRHTLVLDNSGQVWVFGANNAGQLGNPRLPAEGQIDPVPVSGLPPIERIAAGHDYSLAIADDGTVYAFGSNISDQLLGLTGTTLILQPTPTIQITSDALIATGGAHLAVYNQ